MIVKRHKTAIKRNKLSRPVNILVESGLVRPDSSFFDYGCGHGQDLEILEKNGFVSLQGWDPFFRPEADKKKASVVNLGYVLNVIENPNERKDALLSAFELAEDVLCISVMTKAQKSYEGTEYNDGVLTSLNTFQKYFEQSEIKNYIESLLDRDAIAVEPGIFLVFKNEINKISYLEQRYRRPVFLEVTRLDPITKERTRVRVFKPKLEELIKDSPDFEDVLNFVLQHGRIPFAEESSSYQGLLGDFKSKRKIENLIYDNIDEEALLDVRARRVEELLVFFALRRFDRKGFPKKTEIPLTLSYDIQSFFKNYKELQDNATALLFALGNDKIMREAHKHITIGKVLPDAVYIHPAYVRELPAPIQVKIGVAQKLVGDLEGCNLLKINKNKEKVSFMVYEDFDTVAHPALRYSIVVDLPKLTTTLWDFENRENPPILHRKETFVSEDYPSYEKFLKLTKSEEKKGLLSRNDIGTRKGWEQLLKDNNLSIKGHQLKVTN